MRKEKGIDHQAATSYASFGTLAGIASITCTIFLAVYASKLDVNQWIILGAVAIGLGLFSAILIGIAVDCAIDCITRRTSCDSSSSSPTSSG